MLLALLIAALLGNGVGHGHPAPTATVVAVAAAAVTALLLIHLDDLAELFAPLPVAAVGDPARR